MVLRTYMYNATLCATHVHENICTLLDCHGVMFDNWFKSLLMPRVTTSSSSGHSSSQSDHRPVFQENG